MKRNNAKAIAEVNQNESVKAQVAAIYDPSRGPATRPITRNAHQRLV